MSAQKINFDQYGGFHWTQALPSEYSLVFAGNHYDQGFLVFEKIPTFETLGSEQMRELYYRARFLRSGWEVLPTREEKYDADTVFLGGLSGPWDGQQSVNAPADVKASPDQQEKLFVLFQVTPNGGLEFISGRYIPGQPFLTLFVKGQVATTRYALRHQDVDDAVHISFGDLLDEVTASWRFAKKDEYIVQENLEAWAVEWYAHCLEILSQPCYPEWGQGGKDIYTIEVSYDK